MRPELLAPAKNYDVALAAINHGADAVYIGAQRFGAREAAGNSLADVARVVKYAHRYAAKVYLTLNTLLREDELEAARQLAVAAYEVGCDALVVQDMALLELDLPPIPLHASTQAHSATPEKVKFLQDVGFRRVVLARELSLPEVAAIRQAAGAVALEAFVYGALCVSYSGQCYLSQRLAGRSANRGACAQPCRSAYNLIDGEGRYVLRNKHLLSLRDLNLTDYLQALAQAGISSFKVEGRLKDADYVKNVVAHFRRTLDRHPYFRAQPAPSLGQVEVAFEPQPQKTFSRRFTTYFVAAKPQQMATLDTAKAVGEEVGEVQRVEGGIVTLRPAPTGSYPSLRSGDGICFATAQGTLLGAGVNRVEGSRLWLQGAEGAATGARVYRSFDYAFQKQLTRPDSARRRIAVRLLLEVAEATVRLTAVDEAGLASTLTVEVNSAPAGSEAQALATIKAQLSKQSGELFKVVAVSVEAARVPFYALSELNRWRRTVLEQLEQMRDEAYAPPQATIEKNAVLYPERELSFAGNVLNSLARKFYERHGVQRIAPAYEQEPPPHAPLMTTRYCLLRELGCCKQEQASRKLVEPLFLENNGRRLRLKFSCKPCGMTVEEA